MTTGSVGEPRWKDYRGRRVAADYGDPDGEYAAATGAAALFERGHRTRLEVSGRDPAGMLTGILSGTMPPSPEAVGGGVVSGRATYHAVLTPKGRMITDLWCVNRSEEGAERYLLDVPVAGSAPLDDHLRRVLPPRFARMEDVSESTDMLTVAGPEAPSLLSRLALGLRVDAEELVHLEEGAWVSVTAGPPAEGVLVMRTCDVWPTAFNLLGPTPAVAALRRALTGAGARPAGLDVWHVLRVEAGRPVFGADMDERTIPVEAGIHERAIDYTKGCYTGQEVIVRIRDRGHVNRNLRFLELGLTEPPPPGTELVKAGEGPDAPAIGWVTSAVRSPRLGGVVALGYVRREVTGEVEPRPGEGARDGAKDPD